MTSAAARRAYNGPAVLSFGFRPFFLAAALWSALATPVWITSFLTGAWPGIDRAWHIHEMLFGYLAAAIAGFLLTAVPNWTGRMPVIGAPLGALFALWAAGRLAMLGPWRDSAPAAVVDAAFLVVFSLVLWREIFAGRNWRNIGVCAAVSGLGLANIAFHALPQAGAGEVAIRLGLSALAFLIALVGGRITPSFTRNWMVQAGAAPLPEPQSRGDQIAFIIVCIALLAFAGLGEGRIAGGLLLAGGLGALWRLSRWRTRLVLGEPLVWSLHAGYAWLGLALVLMGFSGLVPDLVPRSGAWHALTAGSAGAMTLAVMSRATLGHTGRARRADRATSLSYLLVCVAAVGRIAASLGPAGVQPFLFALSAAAWSLAFGLFLAVYGPMLVSPRAGA